MPWYVFALLDAAPVRTAGRGLSGPITMRKVAGHYAAVERRADVPPVELGALKRHHAVVARLWERVPAVLPVRFGTLLEAADIDEALDGRDDDLREAFDLVRGRAQFSWRGPRTLPTRPPSTVTPRATVTGTEYLRRAARASAPPPRFSVVRRHVRGFIAAERYERAQARIPETLYHLVERRDIGAYCAAASRVPPSGPAPTLSGPFPPYAFVPELL